jgi:hypothetical protein
MNDQELEKYISDEHDFEGNLWYTINDLTAFIVEAFGVGRLDKIDAIKEKVGAIETKGISSNYGFRTKKEAIIGLSKLFRLADKKGSHCYKHGHALSMKNIEPESFGSCEICHTILGWICAKNSPSVLCEYDEEKDPMCDNCLHCGLPADRK